MVRQVEIVVEKLRGNKKGGECHNLLRHMSQQCVGLCIWELAARHASRHMLQRHMSRNMLLSVWPA